MCVCSYSGREGRCKKGGKQWEEKERQRSGKRLVMASSGLSTRGQQVVCLPAQHPAHTIVEALGRTYVLSFLFRAALFSC